MSFEQRLAALAERVETIEAARETEAHRRDIGAQQSDLFEDWYKDQISHVFNALLTQLSAQVPSFDTNALKHDLTRRMVDNWSACLQDDRHQHAAIQAYIVHHRRVMEQMIDDMFQGLA